MPWIKITSDLLHHPKTRRLASLLGTSPPAAVGHLVGIWHNAIDYARDGDLTETERADVAAWACWTGDPKKLLAALENCRVRQGGSGFLDRTESGRLVIHEWDEREGELLREREAAVRRAEASREREYAAREAAGNPVQRRTRPRAVQNPKVERYREERASLPGLEPPTGTALVVRENKAARFIDLVREAGFEPTLQGRDLRELKHTQLTAEQVAEVYVAIASGEWGSDWMRDNLSPGDAIKRWNGYQARGNGGRAKLTGRGGHVPPAAATAMWHPPTKTN